MPKLNAPLRALAAALLVVPALGMAEETLTKVPSGVNFVSPPVVPSFKHVDIRQVPAAAPWQPGDPIREIPRRFEPPEDVLPQPVNPVQSQIDALAQLQRQFSASETRPIEPKATA